MALEVEEVGRTIAGRYRVDEVIGGGGNAAVYRVHDLREERMIALKRSYPNAAGKRAGRHEPLEREFHTLAQLAHPSIIEVYDYGVDDLGAYYTMELLDGRDLHGAGVVPWKRACELLRDVASSLALLHSRGLIHRDVSARNVRCTTDGRAKLIDFGAMTAQGVARDVVGTPPFLAPEALQMQALDGRADLFALGALGYYMLTGQHAFPSRRFTDLRDAWRSRPTPPTRLQADVPPALNALILQLLSLDRGARLQSAAEVMQRVCAIAGLPIGEHTQVSRAYLTSPVLVGRDAALIRMRRRMLGLPRGDGGTLLIRGASGSGRSRLLDVCALEAKLVGASVLRADASEERSDWAVARVLSRQLVRLWPEPCRNAARLSRELLSQVLDGLAPDNVQLETSTQVDRSLLIRELRDFILTVARGQRLVIVVDDVEQIDEPSAALLAALAHKTERSPIVLALAMSSDREVANAASLHFLQLVADVIELDPMVPEQTELLLQFVFGAVPRLALVAARIHALSQGSPRTIMALAQHLVDRGLARYETGSWVLPAQLAESDLPESLSASLIERLAGCSESARALCQALCLADADLDSLGIGDYAELTGHKDHMQLMASLDELVTARILSPDRERHRVVHRGFVAIVAERVTPARSQELHGRLADILARRGGDVLHRADHLLGADRPEPALSLLASVDLVQRHAPTALLSRAVEAAQRLGRPARELHALRKALVMCAGAEMAIEVYRQHAPTVQSELERCSGLSRYAELATLPPAERLKRALADTQEAYERESEHQRVSTVIDAIAALSAFCGFQRALALSTFDMGLLDSLPSLAPLASLTKMLELSELGAHAARQSLCGRFHRAQEQYAKVVSAIEELHTTQPPTPESLRALYGSYYVLGLVDAGRGVATAQAHIEKLAEQRAYQVNAWRVRMLWHLTMGDAEEASRCQRRAELSVLREGVPQYYTGTTGLGELLCHILYEDLTALKQTLQSIEVLASCFPGWRPMWNLGQGHVLRLQGDSARALAMLSITPLPRPGLHATYPYLAALQVQLLCDLGRVEEAVRFGREAVAETEREDLSPTGYMLHVATAHALSHAGDHAAGASLLDPAIADSEAHRHGGVCIGTLYEARARIAARMNDQDTFSRFAEQCSSAYNDGKTPQLAARLASLFELAREGTPLSEASISMRASAAEPVTASEFATLHSRMLECVDQGDRARCALTMLLQGVDSFAGYLYGVNEHDHVLLAALPEDEMDPALENWFAELLEAEREDSSDDDSARRRQRQDSKGSRPSFRFVDANKREFEPLYLTHHEDPQQRLAAVLVYHATRNAKRRPTRELQSELAEQLLEHGDVTGMLLRASNTETRTR